tara:strand:+ start:7 stop:402 length:396 start_codon:yes stop_codon:yes gene_type:complete
MEIFSMDGANIKIILRSDRQISHAIHTLKELKINPEELFELTIKPYKKNRSLEQNALYWKWMMICADELGYTKEGMHQTFMHELLLPIIVDTPLGEIVEYTTTKLKVKEMASYMEQVSFTAGQMGVKLPHE